MRTDLETGRGRWGDMDLSGVTRMRDAIGIRFTGPPFLRGQVWQALADRREARVMPGLP
ncbi:hypothetical protein ACWC9T_20345 [Kitasatospora sp. NPDC001159]